MRPFAAVVLAVLAALSVASAPAEAHGRWRGGVSLHFGVPLHGYWGPGYAGPGYWGPRYWGPRYWGPAYVVPPPVVYTAPVPVYPPAIGPSAPPVYVERDDDAPAAEPQRPVWWYWCPSARGYYPYIKECPGGWQRVPPQPPAN